MKPSWLPTDGFPCLSVQTSTADFARARRFKKVLKMLSSNRSKKAIQALKSRSRIILLCMILVHVIMFAVFRILDNGHNTIINQVRNRAALALPAFTSDWRIPATLAVGLNPTHLRACTGGPGSIHAATYPTAGDRGQSPASVRVLLQREWQCSVLLS